jgi:hypothetical protein
MRNAEWGNEGMGVLIGVKGGTNGKRERVRVVGSSPNRVATLARFHLGAREPAFAVQY